MNGWGTRPTHTQRTKERINSCFMSTIVYNIFIDTNVATIATGVTIWYSPTGQGYTTIICTQLTKERGNSTFLVN